MMDGSGGTTTLMVIIGPILLFAALLWAVLRNRKRSAADRAMTERRTREVYDQGRTEETTHHGQV